MTPPSTQAAPSAASYRATPFHRPHRRRFHPHRRVTSLSRPLSVQPGDATPVHRRKSRVLPVLSPLPLHNRRHRSTLLLCRTSPGRAVINSHRLRSQLSAISSQHQRRRCPLRCCSSIHTGVFIPALCRVVFCFAANKPLCCFDEMQNQKAKQKRK